LASGFRKFLLADLRHWNFDFQRPVEKLKQYPNSFFCWQKLDHERFESWNGPSIICTACPIFIPGSMVTISSSVACWHSAAIASLTQRGRVIAKLNDSLLARRMFNFAVHLRIVELRK
jgi:hypothetical protein